MSTRASICFSYGSEVEAIVYRHYDGMPEGENCMLDSLSKFFADVEEAGRDTRFEDPTILAARYVVWQTMAYRASSIGRGSPYCVLGVRVLTEIAIDSAYVYTVDCKRHDANGRPVVTWKEAR